MSMQQGLYEDVRKLTEYYINTYIASVLFLKLDPKNTQFITSPLPDYKKLPRFHRLPLGLFDSVDMRGVIQRVLDTLPKEWENDVAFVARNPLYNGIIGDALVEIQVGNDNKLENMAKHLEEEEEKGRARKITFTRVQISGNSKTELVYTGNLAVFMLHLYEVLPIIPVWFVPKGLLDPEKVVSDNERILIFEY